MRNILAELQSITNKEEKHLIQVDISFRPEDLEKYINSMNNTSFRYKIFYKDELFKDRLDHLISKYNLDIENKIILEYKLDESVDFSINFKNKISCFTLRDECMYIGIYSDKMKVRNMKDGTIKEMTESDVRMIDFNDKLVLCTENEIIVGKDRIQFFDTATAILQHKNTTFIGTYEGNCYWVGETLNKIEESLSGKIVGIYGGKEGDVITFICITGQILKYNLVYGNTSITQNTFYSTCLYNSYAFRIFGTSESHVKFYDLEDKLLREREVPIRYIEYIQVLENNILVLAGQYDVVVFDVERSLTINKLHFDSEISGMTIYEDRLFISYGNKVDGFKVKNILEDYEMDSKNK